jgi:hypothetical protein
MQHSEQKDIESQQQAPHNFFVQIIRRKRFEEIAKQQKLSAVDADNLIKKHKLYYFVLSGVMYAGSISWVTAPPFQVDKSIKGLDATTKFAFNFTFDSTLSKIIIWPLTVLANLPLIGAYHPNEKAAEWTLSYAKSEKIAVRIQNGAVFYCKHPLLFVWDAVKRTTTFSVNLTGSLVPTMGFADKLKDLPPEQKYSAVAATTLPQYVYYEIYFDMRDALAYMKNKKFPSLWQLKKEREYPTISVIVAQAGSSIVLRGYPFYVSLVLSIEKYFGWYFPVPVVLAGVVIQGLTMYVPTCKRYLSKRVEVNDELIKQHREEFLHILKSHGLSENELDKFANAMRLLKIEEQDRKNKMGYAYRENKGVAVLTSIYGFIGGYLGYQLVSMISPAPYITIPAGMISGAVTASFLGEGECAPVKDGILLRELKKQEPVPERKVSRCEKITEAGSKVSLLALGFINFAMTLGVLESPAALLMTTILLICIQRSTSTVVFNKGFETNLKKWFFEDDQDVKVSEVKSTMYAADRKQSAAVNAEHKQLEIEDGETDEVRFHW